MTKREEEGEGREEEEEGSTVMILEVLDGVFVLLVADPDPKSCVQHARSHLQSRCRRYLLVVLFISFRGFFVTVVLQKSLCCCC